MNRIIKHALMILIFVGSFLITGCAGKRQAVKVLRHSAPWQFSGQAPQSVLSTGNKSATLTALSDSSSFTIKMRLHFSTKKDAVKLLEIPGVLKLTCSQHDPTDRKYQNYPAYPLADASVPVFEAALQLHPPTEKSGRDMIFGIPLGLLKDPEQEHEVVLHFSGVRWTLYVDNELMDNDFALGYPRWGKQSSWEINPTLVSEAEMFFPGLEPKETKLNKPRITPEIQYWTPEGHNSWVGDVATFYHEGRYHVFYLFDRRGHASKFGKGGHYFEHLSTTDFKTWTEHEAATPIEKQWETMGTGTPFMFNNQLCISYGLHTTRIYPKEQTMLPMQYDYLKKHGQTGSFRYDTIPGYPAGSTYSISQDGISKFVKTKILFHPCENPSVYTDPEGKLKMLANYGAKGTWGSNSIDGGWRSLNENFPPGGDCTFFFRWGSYDYVIGGFTGFWTKPASAPDTQFVDGVKAGLDFYNGMNVPAVTQIDNGRNLLAGWIPMAGWGGALVIHEMVQSPSGRIGTKWMEEVIPATLKEKTLAKEDKKKASFATESPSFLLTFDVEPGQSLSGKLGLLFQNGTADDHSCEVQISPRENRAQYANGNLQGFAGKEKSLREGGSPTSARSYAIESIEGTDKAFKVRMVLKYDSKFGGTLIDTEIAGQRTMISFRPDLKVEQLTLRSDQTGIKNLKIAVLKN